jgi:tetratricopeptide (TPR) repeat protein
MADTRRGIRLFYSYSHQDEALRDQLEKHLALLKQQGVIVEWHDRKITAGTEWEGQIDEQLKSADLILLLISSDFLHSKYCYEVEMQEALRRQAAREAVVVPVILRPVDWESAPFGKLQALPSKGKPITTWENQDTAFTDVVQGIRRLVDDLLTSPPDIETRFRDCMAEAQKQLNAEDYKGALATLDAALQLKPDATAHFWRGYCHYQLRAFGDAIGDFLVGAQGSRDYRRILFRAYTFLRLREYQHARLDCDAAIELDPLNPEGYVCRADIHKALDKVRSALADLTQAINLSPRNAELYRRRADLQSEMGDRLLARDDYAQAAQYTTDQELKSYAESRRRSLAFDPLQLSDEEVQQGYGGLGRIRSIESFNLQVEPSPLGMNAYEAATRSTRLFTWAELANLFPVEWVEEFANGRISKTELEEKTQRLIYTTVAEPDRYDPPQAAFSSPEEAKDRLFEAFGEVRDWILSVSGASNHRGNMEAALPRIVDALQWLEANGSQQIARIPLTDISSLASEVSLTLTFSDLVVFIEDSEHTPEESKTKPQGMMMSPALRWGDREGDVVVQPTSFVSYELAWTDRYPTLFRDLQPLLDARRVLYLPLPFSTYQHPDRGTTLRMLRALAWLKPLIRRSTEEELAGLHPAMGIDLPFISGLGLQDLARVFADESDRLAELKVALRKAYSEARAESTTSGEPLDRIFRDIVQSKVDALRRALKQNHASLEAFRKAGASIEAASLQLLQTGRTQRPQEELVKLLFGESAAGIASYLVATGRMPDERQADPFHVLLRLADASNPRFVKRPKSEPTKLWKQPLITATRRSTVTKVERRPE